MEKTNGNIQDSISKTICTTVLSQSADFRTFEQRFGFARRTVEICTFGAPFEL